MLTPSPSGAAVPFRPSLFLSAIPNPQSPIPNPQSPIPNPQSPIPNLLSPLTRTGEAVSPGHGMDGNPLFDNFTKCEAFLTISRPYPNPQNPDFLPEHRSPIIPLFPS